MRSAQTDLFDWGKEITSYHLPRWAELPDINLYMDQVVILIEKQLGVFLYKEGERIITPAMINNYVKLGMIPPPVKKRYCRTHLAYLIMICLLKQVLTISGIKDLIGHQIRSRTLEKFFDYFCQEQERAFADAAAQATQDPAILPNEEDQLILENLSLKMAVLANASITVAGKTIDLQNREYQESGNPQDTAGNLKPPAKHAAPISVKKTPQKP